MGHTSGCDGKSRGDPLMQARDVIVYIAVSAFMSLGLCAAATRRPFAGIARANYRGVMLNPLLGVAVAVSGLWVVAWSLLARAVGHRWEERFDAYFWVLGALVLVLVTGLLDDRSEAGPKGLKGHVESALRGRPTTGLLKVGAALVGGVLVVVGLPTRPWWVMACGVVGMAGCANIWNDLDVAPGRSGRAFLYFALVLPFVGPTSVPQAVLFVLLFAELPALRYDLLEKGMLGDAGSNFLGFAVGAGLYAVLPSWAVGLTALAVVVLNLVGETVTFSRVIAAAPPLRWFDRLGTSPEWRDYSSRLTEG